MAEVAPPLESPKECSGPEAKETEIYAEHGIKNVQDEKQSKGKHTRTCGCPGDLQAS